MAQLKLRSLFFDDTKAGWFESNPFNSQRLLPGLPAGHQQKHAHEND